MNIQTEPRPYCPNCGAQMVLRRPKSYQNWQPFWGCSQYGTHVDSCNGTRDIGADGKPIMDELDHADNDRDMEPLTW